MGAGIETVLIEDATTPARGDAAAPPSPRRHRRWTAALLLCVLAGFAAAHLAAARHLDRAYPWSWSWSELLVDYQGGFVKRGLLGEAAFRLRGTIPPDLLAVAAVSGAYILASAGLILLLRLPAALPGWLFLLSPAGWLFPLLNPAAYGRKDAFVALALVAGMAAARRGRSPAGALLLTMAGFALAGLLVETAWFYYPLVFAAWLSRWREEPLRRRAAAAVVAATFTIGCLLLTLRAPPVDTAAIAQSWGRQPYTADDTGALCCLNLTFAQAATVARSTLPNLRGYALAAALGSLPLALLVLRRPPRRADALTAAATAAGLLSALFPFAVAADWGRYIYLWTTATFLLAWTARGDGPRAAGRPRPDDILARAALIALYASTWQVVHWQHTDRSAVIPGALFRILGVQASWPQPD